MGYTKDSPQYKEMIDTMVETYTLDQCKMLWNYYKDHGVKMGWEQVEEAMRIRERKGIDPSDPDEVKSRFQTRRAKIVNGKFVDMRACLARM